MRTKLVITITALVLAILAWAITKHQGYVDRERSLSETKRSAWSVVATYNAALMAGCERQSDTVSAFNAITSHSGMVPSSGAWKGKVFQFDNEAGSEVLKFIAMNPATQELAIKSHPHE